MSSILIRRLESPADDALLRTCIIDLQETERALDPRLPQGAAMVDAYIATLLER